MKILVLVILIERLTKELLNEAFLDTSHWYIPFGRRYLSQKVSIPYSLFYIFQRTIITKQSTKSLASLELHIYVVIEVGTQIFEQRALSLVGINFFPNVDTRPAQTAQRTYGTFLIAPPL